MQSSGYCTSCESLEARLRYAFPMVGVVKRCLPILLSCMSKVGKDDVSCLFRTKPFHFRLHHPKQQIRISKADLMGGQSAHRQMDGLDCIESESLMERKDRTPALVCI